METDSWKRLFAGEIDVIYGQKGSGKSALYSLLNARESELFDRQVLLAPAENPRGATAFRDLATDPPASEQEFVALWKLYLATLLHDAIQRNGVGGEAAQRLQAVLADEQLVKGSRSLQGILRAAVDYVRTNLRPRSVEGSVVLDPATSIPLPTGKITFHEPSDAERGRGLHSVNEVIGLADQALDEAGYDVWILLDRLDVAFADNPDLEQNALRALFKVYLDLKGFDRLHLKIFLRTDIWRRITSSGFREASHITRHVTLEWNPQALLNLVALRTVQNQAILEYYGTTQEAVLQTQDSQRALFYRMCPEQVEVGPNKPNTFEWMLGRTRDGAKVNAPRELIHFLNSLRDVQVHKLELGEEEPEGILLFARVSFKDALPEVSKARLEQTLFAEYPSLRIHLEALRGSKTRHTTQTLATVWSCSEEEARKHADELVSIGFFERQGDREQAEYWVPFLYRDALDMVQGTAE